MAPDEHDEPEGDGDVTMKSSEKHDPLANGEQNADHLHNDNDVIEEEKIVYHFLYKKWPDFGGAGHRRPRLILHADVPVA